MVATLLASFVAVRCWPSSPFVMGQRTSARDTLVSRRAGNPFDVLGLPRSASYDEIRSAFRSLARTYHPDVPGTGDEDRFRSIREALEQLGTAEGRARWSSTKKATSRSADSYAYSSYSSYSSSSGSSSYGYSTRHRQGQSSWEEEVRSRKTRQEEQRWRQQQKQERDAQKQAKAAAAQDVFFERELRKAIASAKHRQAKRRKEWQQGVKEVLETVRKQQKEDIHLGWDTLDAFKQRRKQQLDDEARVWKSRLEAEQEATASQREKDGKIWVQKFAHVEEEASYRREELGRRYSKRLRDFREDLQQRAENTEEVLAEKIQEEIDNIVSKQDERNMNCWATSYTSMMKKLRRSIAKEPKIWKDGFRTTLIQMGRGGQDASQKWVRKFQDTMREMGEAEKDEVADWVEHFKTLQKKTGQETKWRKLTKASRELAVSSAKTQNHVMQIIERCRKAELKRLKWQAWNHKQWVRKFRQAEDKAFQMQKEEELRLTEEFWQAVKESNTHAAKS
ncbi:dnaJ [Symbiodinium sp. CCMP2456]|nr:dnaJ [Symbiodinium sp. CCMP2456]